MPSPLPARLNTRLPRKGDTVLVWCEAAAPGWRLARVGDNGMARPLDCEWNHAHAIDARGYDRHWRYADEPEPV